MRTEWHVPEPASALPQRPGESSPTAFSYGRLAPTVTSAVGVVILSEADVAASTGYGNIRWKPDIGGEASRLPLCALSRRWRRLAD